MDKYEILKKLSLKFQVLGIISISENKWNMVFHLFCLHFNNIFAKIDGFFLYSSFSSLVIES